MSAGKIFTTPDGGSNWQPVRALRTTPGGLDVGQNDRSVSSKVVVAAAGLQVDIGNVTAGKTWVISDIYFQLDASTCEVRIEADGLVMWQGFVSTNPIGQIRRLPIFLPGGADVDIIFGVPAAGTPNAYFNLGILEQ